jgi:hypothetical protein
MPANLVQLLLGFSVDGSLTTIHPMSQGDPTSGTHDRKAGKPLLYSISPAVLPGMTYIDKLPTELLRECLELAIDKPVPLDLHSPRYSEVENANFNLQGKYTAALSISSTCQRFRAITVPMLYSRIQLIPPPRYKPLTKDRRASMKLVRTINAAPAAREHIRSLGVFTRHFSKFEFVPSLEGFAFTRLTKVHLAVAYDWSTREWDVCCNNLCNLPALSDLRLDLRRQCKHDFRPFCRILGQLPHLSVLTLDGVSSSLSRFFSFGSNWRDTTDYEGEPPSQVCHCRIQRYQTSKLTRSPVFERLRIVHPTSPVLFWP